MNTSIQISKETRDNLAKLGDKDSTFNQIIQELLKKYKEVEN